MTDICICYEHSSIAHFYNLGGTLDVGTACDGILGTCERFVLYELETARVINQGVACYTRFVMVSFGETTINHHQLSVCLDRILSL